MSMNFSSNKVSALINRFLHLQSINKQPYSTEVRFEYYTRVFLFLLASVRGRFVPFAAQLISLLAGNYMDRSTAFKNSTTFFILSSSEDTVFSQAVRALIPNSFAWKEQNEISETNYINHIKISYKRQSTRALFEHKYKASG